MERFSIVIGTTGLFRATSPIAKMLRHRSAIEEIREMFTAIFELQPNPAGIQLSMARLGSELTRLVAPGASSMIEGAGKANRMI
jgi:hypothetical protein